MYSGVHGGGTLIWSSGPGYLPKLRVGGESGVSVSLLALLGLDWPTRPSAESGLQVECSVLARNFSVLQGENRVWQLSERASGLCRLNSRHFRSVLMREKEGSACLTGCCPPWQFWQVLKITN